MSISIWMLVVALAPLSAEAVEYEQVDEQELREGRAGEGPARKTLAERIPAVTGRLFVKQGRFELAPSVGLSLNDPFYDHVVLSAAANFHVLEWLFIGASADFYLSPERSITVVGGGSTERPSYNAPVYAARLEIGWAPIYGKLSLLAEKVLHFDTYVAVGAGVIGPSETDATVGFSIAIGQHYFLSEWLAVRLDIRDQIFELARAPSVNEDKAIQNLFTVSLGFCFYIPPTFEREALVE
jgi:outer membrane beta-barrel protein